MTGRGIVGQEVFRFEAEDTDIVFTIEYDDFVAAELNISNRGSTGRSEGHADSFLAEDIDYARAELGLVGADGEKRLHRVIGKGGYLGIDTVARELEKLSVLCEGT